MNRRDDVTPPTDAEETFVQRWARRKREAAQAPVAPLDASEPDALTPDAQPEQASEPEPPSDEDMPALDSLGPNSDISDFFSPRVSETLRQAALQRIFRQPKFNYSDGLDVYCGDYRSFKPIGNIMTAAMRHRLEAARERLAALGQSPDTDPVDERTASADGREDDPARAVSNADREAFAEPDTESDQHSEGDDNGYA